MKVKMIEISKIDQNENSRVIYKQVDLAELMSSMKKNGLLEPVGVRDSGGGRYEAVFGNRRIVAAKKLGWDEIPAHVLEIETDTDRDVIGLIENLKRQNTSVNEDGLMFQSLLDRGLTIPELAARLDVTETRIRTAVDVINFAPTEFKTKVVYRHGGAKSIKGQLPASTAKAILDIRRQDGLNRQQTRALFKHAANNSTSIQQIKKVSPLLKGGVNIEEAIERVSDLERLAITVYAHRNDIEKLEEKFKTPINKILANYLYDNREFRLVRPEDDKRGFLRLKKANGSAVSKAV